MTHSNSSALYGLWPSPLQPRHVAEGLRLSDVAWDSDGTTLVWHEGRSDRGVLVCLPPGGDAPRDITTDLSVRARVGYGGGDFSVSGGDVYFVEASGRLYRQSLSAGPATALTPAFGYAAAPAVSPQRQWVVFVHTYEGQDCLAMVDTAGRRWPWRLVVGADFYMQPCWHPQDERLAWVAWGRSDVDDTVSGARFLVQQGWADGEKLIVMGGSAGGYTVLQTLIQHPGFFKAAVCLYGISNLFTLATSTHKFEAQYLDSLIGVLPQASADYRERSPIFHAERIRDPIALFQGEEDQVVPRAQAEAIVASLKQRGVPHEYHLYAGEGHGWRRAGTIIQFYTAVEAFLQRYVLLA